MLGLIGADRQGYGEIPDEDPVDHRVAPDVGRLRRPALARDQRPDRIERPPIQRHSRPVALADGEVEDERIRRQQEKPRDIGRLETASERERKTGGATGDREGVEVGDIRRIDQSYRWAGVEHHAIDPPVKRVDPIELVDGKDRHRPAPGKTRRRRAGRIQRGLVGERRDRG